MIWATLSAIVLLFIGYPVWSNQVPDASVFKPLTAQLFTGLMGWLFAVALFVERAVEVVVLVFRDQQADLLEDAVDQATKVLAVATKKANDLADADPAKKTAVDAVEAAGAKLAVAQHDQIVYRAETKEIALLVGFAFGIFISLAGVRALHGLLADNASVGTIFTVADILVTGAVLAGGSEGIHRIANAFSGFMDGLSARSDQVQRNANNDVKPDSKA